MSCNAVIKNIIAKRENSVKAIVVVCPLSRVASIGLQSPRSSTGTKEQEEFSHLNW